LSPRRRFRRQGARRTLRATVNEDRKSPGGTDERAAHHQDQRIDDVPGYLARYAAEVDAWAADASARRA
jgi:hypothetical protein